MCPVYTSGSVGWRGDAHRLLQLSLYPLSLKEKRAAATARAVFNFGRKLRLQLLLTSEGHLQADGLSRERG